jgi:iron(III) transport system ATP-binding protein
MGSLRLVNIGRRFGGFTAVQGVNLDVADGEFLTLLGPSGCGKTTTLRMVAGFIAPDTGEILFNGVRVNDVPPHKRNTAMVFQSYALFPHMTVAQNVSFGLKMRKMPAAEQAVRVAEALEMVSLGGLEKRRPGELSGGQQQRVALARAIATRPDFLLFDEPLSNLDARLRDKVKVEIRDLQRRLGITALYVTHDQSEALSMSDRVAVMNQGRIVQEAAPRDLYYQPADRFVADFVGRVNMIPAVVRDRDGAGDALVEAFGTRLVTPCPSGVAKGADVTVTFRPESVRWHEAAPDRPNLLPARVVRVEFLGEIVEYEAEVLSGQTVVGSIVGRGAPLNSPATGDSIFIELTPQACRVLAA